MLMDNPHKIALATEIENRNPYSRKNTNAANQGMELQDAYIPQQPAPSAPPIPAQGGWDSQIETDSYEIGYWKFRDRSLRVVRAIRIPYIYRDEDGNKVREHLLIGFEGSSGE